MHPSSILVLFAFGTAATAAGIVGVDMCPQWTSSTLRIEKTADNHCCVYGRNTVLGCCTLKNVSPLDKYEPPCTSEKFQSSEAVKKFFEWKVRKQKEDDREKKRKEQAANGKKSWSFIVKKSTSAEPASS